MDFVQSGKCAIVLSTSNDDRFPACSILDGQNETFWVSTGMFPQEITIRINLDGEETQRPTLAKISKIELQSTGIKRLILSSSTKKLASQFEKLIELQMEDKDPKLQVETIQLNNASCHYLNLQIMSAWDNFVTISKIAIEGEIDDK
jgi:heat shock protein beta-11